MLGKDRTLIIAQGLEYERILAAISLHHPTKLLILRSQMDVSENLRERVDKIINGIIDMILSQQGRRTFPWITDKSKIREYRVDFFDLTKAIAQIDQIIATEKEAGNTVVIDLSSGNKIISLALYICSRLHEVSSTYCVAGKYAREQPAKKPLTSDISIESVSFSVQRHVELPEVPIEPPRVPFSVLKKIVEHEGGIDSIKTLAELLQGDEPSQSDIVKISRHVETLEGFGYVRRQRKGRKVAIRVTEKGRILVNLADAPSFTRSEELP